MSTLFVSVSSIFRGTGAYDANAFREPHEYPDGARTLF